MNYSWHYGLLFATGSEVFDFRDGFYRRQPSLRMVRVVVVVVLLLLLYLVGGEQSLKTGYFFCFINIFSSFL